MNMSETKYYSAQGGPSGRIVLAGLNDMTLNGLDRMKQTFANLQTMEHSRQSQHSLTCTRIILSNGINVGNSSMLSLHEWLDAFKKNGVTFQNFSLHPTTTEL